MSPQERELQSMQLDMLREQRGLIAEQMRMQDLLAPYFYKQAGLKPIYDAGKIVGFEEIDNELSTMRKDVEKGLLQRSQQALEGKLPVDPALERSIADSRRDLEATLAQQLGAGYASSTPGQQALADATKRAEELRMGARRGELTLSEGLGLAREGSNEARQGALMTRLLSSYGASAPNTSASTGYLNSLAGALSGYGAQRQGQFQANMFNAQQPGVGDFFGGLAGIGLGAFLGPFAGALGRRAAGGVGGLFSGLFGGGGGGGTPYAYEPNLYGYG
jgi:hypothetical protein